MAMIGSLAQGLVGVIVDEVAAQGGRQMQQQRERGASFQQQQHNQQQQQHDGQYQPQQQYTQQRRQQHQHQLPPGPLASLVESMTMLVNRAVAAAVTGLQYLLLFEAVLLSAVILYGALYWLVMPLRLHDKPIFLDYSDRATTGGATGTVDFLARHTQWDPSPLTNVERLNTKVLNAGQHYKVGLELQMPTSYINRRVGVFMVHTTLLDEQDNELASSARPAMLPHTSALRKGVGMMFAWPLHLAGLRREEETIYVDCIDYYEENALHPLTKARVTVSSGRVQFYSSSINITPQLKGLPWLMHDFFYSTLAAGVLFIASLELMLFGFCYVFFFVSLEESDKNDKSSDTGVTSHRVSTVAASRGDRSRTSSASHSVTGIPNNTGRLSSSLSAAVTASGGCTGRGYPTTETNGGRESPPARETAATMPRDQGVFHDYVALRRRAGVGGGRSGTVAGGGPTVEPASAAVSGSRRSGSGSVSSASTENRDTFWMGKPTSSLPSWLQEAATAAAAASTNRRQQEAPTLPPGVQAYQRGTRYIAQGSRAAAVAGSGGSGGAAGGSDPGGELEAAALAPWAALEGNTIEPRRETAACEGRGHGGVAAVVDATETVAQGVRVVEFESASADRAAVDGDDVAGSGCSRPTSGFGGADATLVDSEPPAVSAAPEGWRVLDLS